MSKLIIIILITLLAFIGAYRLARYFLQPNSKLRIFDHSSSRSLHQGSVPRTGGLAILATGLVCSALTTLILPSSGIHLGFLLLGIGPLAIVSFWDDCHQMPAQWRLFAHAWSVCILMVSGYALDLLELPNLVLHLPKPLTVISTLLFGIWMINLYNFMDGMDGFAAGMAVIGFVTLAWLGWSDPDFASLCLIVAAASAGFLVYNFPPAKIFMGDVGSTSLGFLVAACSLWGSKTGLFPLWIAILVFSPFIVDATVTLLRRLLHGEKVWQAHRSHYYQRLVLLGWGHRKTVLAEYGLMLACAGSAMLALHLPPTGQVWLILAWAFIYGGLIWGVGRLEQRRATVSAP